MKSTQIEAFGDHAVTDQCRRKSLNSLWNFEMYRFGVWMQMNLGPIADARKRLERFGQEWGSVDEPRAIAEFTVGTFDTGNFPPHTVVRMTEDEVNYLRFAGEKGSYQSDRYRRMGIITPLAEDQHALISFHHGKFNNDLMLPPFRVDGEKIPLGSWTHHGVRGEHVALDVFQGLKMIEILQMGRTINGVKIGTIVSPARPRLVYMGV